MPPTCSCGQPLEHVDRLHCPRCGHTIPQTDRPRAADLGVGRYVSSQHRQQE